jgi:hypothetical protein
MDPSLEPLPRRNPVSEKPDARSLVLTALGDLVLPSGGQTWLGALHDPLLAVALPLILTGIVAGVAALVVRYRRALASERQQLKWAVFGGGASVTMRAIAASGIGRDLSETGQSGLLARRINGDNRSLARRLR